MTSLLRIKDRLFYGWVVVAAFLIMGVIFFGARLSFGVFFKSIESEFSLTRTVTSGVFSVQMVLGCAFALLCGWALDRYGPRIIVLLMGLFTGLSLLLTSQVNDAWQLFITYSLLLSLGTSAAYVVIVSTVSRWFDKKRGLAVGIATAGAGLGTVIVAPFATYLISNFGWRMAYIVMGLIAWLVVIPFSRLLRRNPYEIGALPDGVKSDSRSMELKKSQNTGGGIQPTGLSIRQVFRTGSFWLFEFAWILYASCVILVLTHIVPHVTDIGHSAGEAAIVLSLISGTTAAGRILLGSLSDRIGRKVTAIICSLVQVGAMVWLSWTQSLWMLYLFSVVYGFAQGGLLTVINALIGDTFGLRNIGVIFGVLGIGWGVGAAIGPTIGGFIFDISNSYFMAFLIGALTMFIATLLIALTRQELVRKPAS